MAGPRARKSIEEKIASGEHYDAQQMVKTLHRRLCSKGEWPAAADFCVESACRFSAVDHHELAADLGKDLVESYEASEVPPSDESLGRVEAIFGSIPPRRAVAPKYAFLHRALKWSAGSATNGHPRLHHLAAQSYWAEKEFGKCQAHFVYCGDGPSLANMVSEWRKSGYPNEKDLYSLRTLLILLSLNDLVTARTFWDAITAGAASPASAAARAAQNSQLPVPEPPVQCGTLLLAAGEARSHDFFRAVRSKYAIVLRRDHTFNKYLDEIEARVFGCQQPRAGLGALFEALLGGGGPAAPVET